VRFGVEGVLRTIPLSCASPLDGFVRPAHPMGRMLARVLFVLSVLLPCSAFGGRHIGRSPQARWWPHIEGVTVD
jgi:hypothetical protein